MTCRELIDRLAEYVEGELSKADRAVFDGHLAECPECVAYLDSYRKTLSLIRAVARDPDAPVPEDTPEDLIEAIVSARKESSD